MKKILPLLIFILSSSYAGDFHIKKISLDEGFAYNFTLETDNKQNFIDLDCQSFLHKIDFYKNNQIIAENFIDIHECSYIYEVTTNCIEKYQTRCINPENFLSSSCDCH